MFGVPICAWNTLFPNWSFRTVLFGVLFVRGTHCSQIGHLGLFCLEFLSVNGTPSQIGHIGLLCSEFLSVNQTHCSQIARLDRFVPSCYLGVEHIVLKLIN